MTVSLRLRAAIEGRTFALRLLSYFNSIIADCKQHTPRREASSLKHRETAVQKLGAFKRARFEWRKGNV